jgi:hypothetical protein
MSDFREVVFSPIARQAPGVGGALSSDASHSESNDYGAKGKPSGQWSDFLGSNGQSKEAYSFQKVNCKNNDTNDRIAKTSENSSAGDCTVFGASFNFVNSIVGAGIIGVVHICSSLHRSACIFQFIYLFYYLYDMILTYSTNLNLQRYISNAPCNSAVRIGVRSSLAGVGSVSSLPKCYNAN